MALRHMGVFQPFLRFNLYVLRSRIGVPIILEFQPFLRFNDPTARTAVLVLEFQPFLRFNLRNSVRRSCMSLCSFQPFLRFNIELYATTASGTLIHCVSTLLEIQPPQAETENPRHALRFQPFLRFNMIKIGFSFIKGGTGFQPFLRFNGSCVWLLWVFKFFFGFFVFSAVGLRLRFTFISFGVG